MPTTIVTVASKGAPLSATDFDNNMENLKAMADAAAPRASPVFTGTPAAPTAAVGVNTEQVATTAFVKSEFDARILRFYGVSWDESLDIYTRTGTATGLAPGAPPPNVFLTVQSRMRRCLIDDAGTVNYYLNASDSTKKEDGTPSVLTGADGQVMVEIPKFWYRYNYTGTTHTWEVSPVALAGFNVHPAFISGVTELNYLYVGAYEAVLWDATSSTYIDYVSGAVITPADDKLSSVSGLKPVSNFTRASGRTMAAKRGAGWSQMFADGLSAIQLLFLTEYASFNSQNMIGAGIVNIGDWASIGYYSFALTGNSNPIGNATGNTAGATVYATEAIKYMSYRGIENWYGHIWKWLDGININNNIPYLCNVQTNFADDTVLNYARPIDSLGADITMHNVNGYQSTLKKTGRGFFLASIGAASSTKITDYYYQAAGWRVALSGGGANDGADGGGFSLSCSFASGDLYAHFGSRVCFRK